MFSSNIKFIITTGRLSSLIATDIAMNIFICVKSGLIQFLSELRYNTTISIIQIEMSF